MSLACKFIFCHPLFFGCLLRFSLFVSFIFLYLICHPRVISWRSLLSFIIANSTFSLFSIVSLYWSLLSFNFVFTTYCFLYLYISLLAPHPSHTRNDAPTNVQLGRQMDRQTAGQTDRQCNYLNTLAWPWRSPDQNKQYKYMTSKVIYSVQIRVFHNYSRAEDTEFLSCSWKEIVLSTFVGTQLAQMSILCQCLMSSS